MKGWSGVSKLGAVETIFEEDEETEGEEEEVVKCSEFDESSLSSSTAPMSPPLSPISCPSSPDLDSIVDSWSLAKRKRPDVKINVQSRCFNLHKDVLSSKSLYLRRHLSDDPELTLPPSLKLTADTFTLIAEFCYTLRVAITPFNLAALRTASDSLEMHTGGDNNLHHKTEGYFCRFVAVNRDFATIVFRSCLALLPEVEERGCLASRCLEVMCEEGTGEGEGREGVMEVIRVVRPEDFVVIVDSMQRRFTRSHDFLYGVIDLYLKVYDGKMSEDQKTQICNVIDCNMISPEVLMRAVQNPRMPLRFVVQAMLTEQLNTHRSICTAATTIRAPTNHRSTRAEPPPNSHNAPTLGAILQQDAANRQVTQLKAAINTTMSRIHCLEKELGTMKQRLIESERHRGVADSDARSASFRFSNESGAHKIERGERGSISSDHLRFRVTGAESPAGRIRSNVETSRMRKSRLGTRLINGLKSVFRVSKDSKVGGSSKEGEDYVYGEDDDVFKEGHLCTSDGMGIAALVHSHNRARSIS